MKLILTQEDQIFGPWLARQTGFEWVPGKGSTIGLLELGVGPVAATYFESFNGASILMHCAGIGKKWLNREFLWYSFYYPFEELGVRKIISPVESSNTECVKFIKHIGFRLEATLKDASPQGDLNLYTLCREDCKWLSLRGKYRGETKAASSA